MEISAVSANGEITLPEEIQKNLHLKEGDYIFFEEKDGEIVIKKAASSD